jgi:hypothetical protein
MWNADNVQPGHITEDSLIIIYIVYEVVFLKNSIISVSMQFI